MKTKKPYLSAAVLGIVIAVALFLVLDVVAPAFSTSAVTWLLAPVSAPTPAPGDPIPLKSIEGLNSLNATVKLDVNGKINGKKTKGDLNALLASNDQKKSKVTVSGSLLGPIAAQVGGSVLGMFTPSKVDLYKVPAGTYIAVNSLVPICVKPDTSDATAALDELSPSSMMNMLTGSDVARGKFVGDEKLATAYPSSTTSSTGMLSSPPRRRAAIRNCRPLARRCGRPMISTCMWTPRAAIRSLCAATSAARSSRSSSKGTWACRSN